MSTVEGMTVVSSEDPAVVMPGSAQQEEGGGEMVEVSVVEEVMSEPIPETGTEVSVASETQREGEGVESAATQTPSGMMLGGAVTDPSSFEIQTQVVSNGRTAIEMVEYTIEDMADPGPSPGGIAEEKLDSPSPTLASALVRPPLTMRENIIAFAEKYSINLASKRFKVQPNTIKKWMRAENVHMKPKFNSPGQGRKISYAKETDQAIADHIKGLVAKGEKVSIHDLCSYAKTKILEENPTFNASTGWAQRFLLRHGIDLGHQRPRKDPPSKGEPRTSSESRGRPLSYSSETDQTVAEYVRNRQSEGQTVTNSELRKYAKELILKENPNFTASASWAQNFLLRHKLSLHPGEAKDVSTVPTHLPAYIHTLPTSLSSTSIHQLITTHLPTMAGAISVTDNPTMTMSSTAVSSVLSDPTISDSSVSIGADYTTDSGVDDPMKTALAILTGENIDSAILNPAQAAALQSTLSELTSDSVSLVDLLSSAQQLQEQTGNEGAVALITHGLESPSSGALYLGLQGTSEAFTVGLTGVAATQLNPNTQTPILPLPRVASVMSEPSESGQASRPLSYTKETDQVLANWVQEQQAAGKKVTFASLRAYAKKLVSSENPNFNASVGWVTPFLLRHNLDLSINKKKKQPRKCTTPRKIENSTPEGVEERLLEAMEVVERGTGEVTMEAFALAGTPSTSGVSGTNPNPEEVQGVPNLHLSGEPPLPSEGTQPMQQSQDPLQSVPKAEDTSTSEAMFTPLRRSKGQRVRHTLSEKLEVVRLMKEYNMAAHYMCRMLGIANSTIAGWIKLVQQKGAELEVLSSNKKRANVSGQGRPLSYSKEKDEAIARWVRSQQELGLQITPADLAKYATTVIGEENAGFTASSGWQQKFLQRHSMQLTPKGDKTPVVEDQNVPAPVQTEEVVTHEFCTNLLEKPYSDEIDKQLAKWAKERVQESNSLSIQNLCRKAEDMIVEHNPMFVATLGWAFKFLHRHNLMLDPKPAVAVIDSPTSGRKRGSDGSVPGYFSTPKKICPAPSIEAQDVSVSPSTGNLCEALLALSNQAQEGGESVQAAVQAVQSAIETIQQHQALEQQQDQQQEAQTSAVENQPQEQSSQSSSSTYFGKPAREFTQEEKEEVVRYANATTLQKAALKYGVAAPTVWRWRVELKLHQPKYTSMQKKYIIKFAETNSLKEAAQRYGITSKTIQNWRKALQAEGELPSGSSLVDESSAAPSGGDAMDSGEGTSEVVTYDNQNFQFIVDGGEVVDTNGNKEQNGGTTVVRIEPVPLEITNEVDIENVGMEYDVISSEGHAAKPRCTQQEKIQILQYALEHSIKEASQKFGISPGTLYYWKKSFSGNSNLTGEKGASPTTHTSSSALSLPAASIPIDSSSQTAMNVQFAGISGEANVLQALNPAATSEGINVIISPEQFISTSAATTMENLQVLSQTLANMTPEALQNLPTTDINLLQAVSSLLSNAEVEGDSRRRKPSTGRRHESSSGGISSPTEVLVPPPFHPSAATREQETATEGDTLPQVVSMEEVPTTENAEVTVSTNEEAPIEVTDPPISDILVTEEVSGSAEDQPAVVEMATTSSQDGESVAVVSETVELPPQGGSGNTDQILTHNTSRKD